MLSLQVEKGEFFCPLCRQLSNQVLPVFSREVKRPEEEGKKDWKEHIGHIADKLGAVKPLFDIYNSVKGIVFADNGEERGGGRRRVFEDIL